MRGYPFVGDPVKLIDGPRSRFAVVKKFYSVDFSIWILLEDQSKQWGYAVPARYVEWNGKQWIMDCEKWETSLQDIRDHIEGMGTNGPH